MAQLGEAFVRVRPDTTGFQQEAENKVGGGLKRVAGLVSAAFASIKVGGFLKDAIGEASDYGETVSKSANVFGAKLQPAILAFAKTAPRAFGLSETAALSATAQFGNMFQQLGFTGDAAAKASTNLIKTAADLGSFNNVDPSDVLERIGASLRGEFDSLQQLIPNINAARVETEALAATGKKAAKDLTAQEKAQATLAIIQKDGALAANDFAETSGGLANQQRILSATVDTLQARLGTALLPTVTKVVTYLAANAEPAFNRVEAAVRGFLDGFRGTGDAGQLEGALSGASKAGADVKDALDKARPAVKQLIAEVRSGNTEVPSFAGVLDVGAGALKLIGDNADTVVKALPFLVAGFVAVKTAQAAGNVAALASLPIQAATVASNFAAASANRALATAIASQTVIQNANSVATTRGAVATVASTVASTAASAATKAYAAVQVVLNTVLAANPIGLVVAAVALLVGGLILAYKNSETFRTIVQTTFRVVGQAAIAAVDLILRGLQLVAAAAGKLPGPLGAPFRAAEKAIGSARDKLQGLSDKLDSVGRKKATPTITLAGVGKAEQDLLRLERRITNIGGVQVAIPVRAVGGGRAGGVQARANGGPVSARRPYLVGELGPELVVPQASGTVLTAAQTAGLGGAQIVNHFHGVGPDVERAVREPMRELAFALSTGA
jgi:hypothetical protein